MKPIMKTLSNRAVGKLEVEKDTVFRDGELTGFGVRVYPTGARVYIAQARGPEGPKRVAVGSRRGVIHAEQARQRAALIIARIKADEANGTPAREKTRLPLCGRKEHRGRNAEGRDGAPARPSRAKAGPQRAAQVT